MLLQYGINLIFQLPFFLSMWYPRMWPDFPSLIPENIVKYLLSLSSVESLPLHFMWKCHPQCSLGMLPPVFPPFLVWSLPPFNSQSIFFTHFLCHYVLPMLYLCTCWIVGIWSYLSLLIICSKNALDWIIRLRRKNYYIKRRLKRVRVLESIFPPVCGKDSPKLLNLTISIYLPIKWEH